MTAQKTYYNLDDGLFIVDGHDSPEVAAARLRLAWARSACPTIASPFRRSDIIQAFARANDDIDFQGSLSSFVADRGYAMAIPKGTDARIYSLWTVNPLKPNDDDYIEPQMDVMERRPEEVWVRTIESLSLREFVNDNTDDNDADRSRLYRIKMWTNEHELIHGANIERMLDLIGKREGSVSKREGSVRGYATQIAKDHVRQLERALEDHLQRTATPGYHP